MGADVAHFDEVIPGEGVLEVEVVFLGVGVVDVGGVAVGVGGIFPLVFSGSEQNDSAGAGSDCVSR